MKDSKQRTRTIVYLLEHPPEEKLEIRNIMLKKNGETQWNKILDESIRDESLNVLLDEIKVENGEKSSGNTRDHSPERSAIMPESITRVTSDTIVKDGDN